MPQALVLGFFTAVTSPLGVVRLLVLLALRLPLAAARGVLSFLFPSLFWKSVQGEVVYVTGGAGGIGKLMSQKVRTARPARTPFLFYLPLPARAEATGRRLSCSPRPPASRSLPG